MRNIRWEILVIAVVIQFIVQTIFESIFAAFSIRFMLVLATPIWGIVERYSYSPLGKFLTYFAVVISFFAGGYTISYVLRRWRGITDHLLRIYHVLLFILFYIVVYVMALGFNVPNYAHRLSFGETATWMFAAIATFVGSYVVERDDA